MPGWCAFVVVAVLFGFFWWAFEDPTEENEHLVKVRALHRNGGAAQRLGAAGEWTARRGPRYSLPPPQQLPHACPCLHVTCPRSPRRERATARPRPSASPSSAALPCPGWCSPSSRSLRRLASRATCSPCLRASTTASRRSRRCACSRGTAACAAGCSRHRPLEGLLPSAVPAGLPPASRDRCTELEDLHWRGMRRRGGRRPVPPHDPLVPTGGQGQGRGGEPSGTTPAPASADSWAEPPARLRWACAVVGGAQDCHLLQLAPVCGLVSDRCFGARTGPCLHATATLLPPSHPFPAGCWSFPGVARRGCPLRLSITRPRRSWASWVGH